MIKQVSRKTTEMLSSLSGRALSTSGQTQTVTPLLTLVAVLPGSDAGFICLASIEFRHLKPSDLVLRESKMNDQDD